MKTSNSIAFVHPALRTYRMPLFEGLSEMGVDFIFSSQNDPNTFDGRETHELLNQFKGYYEVLDEIPGLPFKNASLELYRLLRYKTIIFSGCTSIPYLTMAPLLRTLGKKVLLFDEMWTIPQRPAYLAIATYLEKTMRTTTSQVIAAGSKCQEFYSSKFSFPENRIHVAYNTTVDLKTEAWNEQELSRLKERIKRDSKGRPTILYLGRIVKYKGLDLLIQAMAELDCHLVVVGSGDFEDKCHLLAQSLKIRDRVSFFGPCENHETLYYFRACDLFCLPSRVLPAQVVPCESWGYTLNEAMSLEIPVISSTGVGSAFDLIQPGITGFMAEQGSSQSLKIALTEALKDLEKSQQIGRAGREHLLKTCNYQQNLEAFKAALMAAKAL